MYSSLPEPPTASTIAAARQDLSSQKSSLETLSSSISHAELELANLIAESEQRLSSLRSERLKLEDKLLRTMAYVSPMRRLPNECLREVFLIWFESYPCASWIIASVCVLWRKLALGMPKIWSKIRLLTTQHASADTIRLWLERSGSQVPLDIEIYLRVNKKSSPTESLLRSPRLGPLSPWIPPPFPHSASSAYGVALPASNTLTIPPPSPSFFPPAHTPVITPPLPTHGDGWGSSSPKVLEKSPTTARKSSHWGHIAIYYLMEQIHRWERFVFRFDKQFSSMNALKSITGDAPLLREFEISCGEPTFYTAGDMQWLPSLPATSPYSLPSLRSLTLQNCPFKWSSPIFRPTLTSLTLRALPTTHLALDRILSIVSANPFLETLSITFGSVLPAILPLNPSSLSELRELNVGGHYLLTLFVDALILPALDNLSIDIESRDPVEDTITNLLARGNHPPLRHLSISYASYASSSGAGAFFFGPGGMTISWGFLGELGFLRSLKVGGTAMECLLGALGAPDEEGGGGWNCPRLEVLEMRGCQAHSDGVGKLVQMVDERNPALPGSISSSGSSSNSASAAAAGISAVGMSVGRLKRLALYDCTAVGVDVVSWLKTRVGDVVCCEPSFERSTVTGNPYL